MNGPNDNNITIIPLRGMRGMIADKMLKSINEAPQLTHHATVDVTALNVRRKSLIDAGVRVSVEDLFAEAIVKTLGTYPDLNGKVEGREVRLSKAIHISVAIALPGNRVLAPTIFDAHKKSVGELRDARRDLSVRAKANKLTVPEMTGGSFSISNLGLGRVEHFTPILNIPQIAILGIGCARVTACPGPDGKVAFRQIAGLSLTFDHRAVDGAPAAAFLTDLCVAIEKSAD
jgi:pyruvate/2-oxoglutarate dehydrogenase complex dihydrolipoamide acyltransferase (E2) component